ncbi:GL15103 [Drosophila persimilis]|uniref:GL15103 n=1 Tax=Drosophila persimilis TaxID=7234 RepID=B4GPW5_DROPE|nr:GL15103 [Drosophila persimilis]
MPAPAAIKPASGHTTKLNNGKSNTSHNTNNNTNTNINNSHNTLCNSIAHLSDSRTNLTVNTPTTCQRLSEMFRRSIASSTQSSSRENTYEEVS